MGLLAMGHAVIDVETDDDDAPPLAFLTLIHRPRGNDEDLRDDCRAADASPLTPGHGEEEEDLPLAPWS